MVLPIFVLLCAVVATSHEYRALPLDDGTALHYAIVLPERFDAAETYPVLLALPPGPQTREMVEAGLERYWGAQAAAQGWVVISPIAPAGSSFYTGAERAIPALLDRIGRDIKVEGGRFHLAGASNGGRSAFHIALAWPGRFQSLTVLPGFPPTEADARRLSVLKTMPITMFVGSADTRWLAKTLETRDALAEAGATVMVRVLEGEGHVPPSLDGGVIMTHLETVRQAGDVGASERAVGVVLDELHAAAAAADAARYFALFAPEAVFMGTDATERWTLEEFRAYAEPIFAKGRGWTYHRRARNIMVAEDGRTAWFDEALHNEKYGTCRGTGVLTNHDGKWRIVQYNLSLPIPNAIAETVVQMIREHESDGSDPPSPKAPTPDPSVIAPH